MEKFNQITNYNTLVERFNNQYTSRIQELEKYNKFTEDYNKAVSQINANIEKYNDNTQRLNLLYDELLDVRKGILGLNHKETEVVPFFRLSLWPKNELLTAEVKYIPYPKLKIPVMLPDNVEEEVKKDFNKEARNVQFGPPTLEEAVYTNL